MSPEELARDIEGILARVAEGDEVLVERDGKVLARVVSQARTASDVQGFLRARMNEEPLDEEWERNVLQAMKDLNRPVEIPDWPS